MRILIELAIFLVIFTGWLLLLKKLFGGNRKSEEKPKETKTDE